MSDYNSQAWATATEVKRYGEAPWNKLPVPATAQPPQQEEQETAAVVSENYPYPEGIVSSVRIAACSFQRNAWNREGKSLGVTVFTHGESRAFPEHDLPGPLKVGHKMYALIPAKPGTQPQLLVDAGRGANGSPAVSFDGENVYFSMVKEGDRLLVGGFEKVYELNRNFRNEGISTRHNPEFTMLEFYWAYADVNAMMDFCEQMLRAVVFKVLGHTHAWFGDQELDFGEPFRRVGMRESLGDSAHEVTNDNVLDLFEERVEHGLIQPTFITDFPKPISPLSKASPANPALRNVLSCTSRGWRSRTGFRS